MTRRRLDVNEKRSAKDAKDWDSREISVKAWIENVVCYMSFLTGDLDTALATNFMHSAHRWGSEARTQGQDP
jgi:hypothetical protein